MLTNSKNINKLADTVRKIMSEQDTMASEVYAKQSLANALRKVLADGYILYYTAHSSHWNVEGSNFPQYHTFFEKIYSEVYEQLDNIAEKIRTINAYAPVSLKDLLALTNTTESVTLYHPTGMLTQLGNINNRFLESISIAFKTAEAANEIGISNYLQDLTDKQRKLGWMISATLKGE
jgi:starvation-inducible DNA-binding protein